MVEVIGLLLALSPALSAETQQGAVTRVAVEVFGVGLSGNGGLAFTRREGRSRRARTPIRAPANLPRKVGSRSC